MTETKIKMNEEMMFYQTKIAKLIPKISKYLTQVEANNYLAGKENAIKDFNLLYKMMKWNATIVATTTDPLNTTTIVTGMMSPEKEKDPKSTDAEFCLISPWMMEWFLYTASIAQWSTMIYQGKGEKNYIEQNNSEIILQWETLEDGLIGTPCTIGILEEIQSFLKMGKSERKNYMMDLAAHTLIHAEIYSMSWKGRWDLIWDKESTSRFQKTATAKEKYWNLHQIKRQLQMWDKYCMRSFMLGYINNIYKNIHEISPKWKASFLKIINTL